MEKFDASNGLFRLAFDLVNKTARDIFVTGKAGSGKTTFLKYVRENCPKQMAIVAPTGVAAINAGGVTIHSFFQLPLAPFIPRARPYGNSDDDVSDRRSLLSHIRLNSERRKVLQELELLIIDEVSMVRCDVLDAIDVVLRHVRYRPRERFGGVQVLLVGDLFQLPPVVKDQEWRLLSEYYDGPFFFDSLVLKEAAPVCVEFTRIYRQTEEKFIGLLNKVRNNDMDEESLRALHERFQPAFFGNASDGYILLTTHNEKARKINARELGLLPGDPVTYKAGIDGEFPNSAFPADENLQLKIGAQVMFIRNDMDKARRYFNGKIGRVCGFEEGKVLVKCNDDSSVVEVSKESWRNIRYTLDKTTRQLNEDVLGSFSQYPLRLAWAITIHKSQGLTFEKAVIDAGQAFAPGQVYVALSRCTSLGGLVLHSRIQAQSLFADDRIVRFTKGVASAAALQNELAIASKAYQEKLIASLFDFGRQVGLMADLKIYLGEHNHSFNEGAVRWANDLSDALLVLHRTGARFSVELNTLFAAREGVVENDMLSRRIKAATDWFSRELKALLASILELPIRTDSSIHAKMCNALLKEVFVQCSFQLFMMQGFVGKFDMDKFHRRKRSFVVPAFNVSAYAGTSAVQVSLEHQDLYEELREVRDAICTEKNLPIYLVAGSRTLEELTVYLPQDMEELQRISGFGKAKAERYGPRFLPLIIQYCKRHGLESTISSKKPKRVRKGEPAVKQDTKAETFRMYLEDKTVDQIARERKLAPQTIEGHLAHYVRTGELKIEQLLLPEKLKRIQGALDGFTGGSIIPVKQSLDASISFGEIRLALAFLEHQRSSSHEDH